MNEIFEAIESPKVGAKLSLASSLNAFFRIASNEAAIRALRTSVVLNGPDELVRRIDDVAERVPPKDESSQWDHALAIYLWLLVDCNEQLARISARKIEQLPYRKWWWSRKTVERLVERDSGDAVAGQSPEKTTSIIQESVFIAPGRLRSIVSGVSDPNLGAA
jgi:hypothetical protein